MDIALALKIVNTPRTLSVKGKLISPDIFFSKELALPLVYWYGASLSEKMFGISAQWGDIRSNPEHLLGMSIHNHAIDNAFQHVNSLGVANKLLIMAEAVNQILHPATVFPSFDYGAFLVKFRDAVDYHHEAGEIVPLGDVDLHKIIYNDILKIKPSQNAGHINTKHQPSRNQHNG